MTQVFGTKVWAITKTYGADSKSAPFLCFQKSNVLVSRGAADVADPRQFGHIQLTSL